MTQDHAMQVLGTRLCPWLRGPFDRLEAARREGRLGHAWLLKGPAGIGKLNLALVFAQRLLEEVPPGTPVPVLDADAAAAAMLVRHAPTDHHPDLHWIFPEEDKRTISIDQVRDAAHTLALKGFRGRSKVVVVEPAEAMTPAAANALLKTLEEPSAQTYLLLVSHQADRLLSTIRSRCQTLVVPPPTEEVACDWLRIADDPRREALVLLSGRSPLQALALMSDDKSPWISELEKKVTDVSRRRLDAKALAEEWVRNDVGLALTWLVRRLQASLRQRALPADSTTITHRGGDSLHNAWLAMPTDALFERLRSAEKLLDQLGSGINVDLALHALLLSFQTTDRGRT